MSASSSTVNTKFCSLSRLPFFGSLPECVRHDLEESCRVLRFEAGETVVHLGDLPDYIGCVNQGFLRMQKTLADGRQHIVGLLVDGDMFGRVFDGPLHFDIEAATDAEVCALKRSTFESVMLRSPDLERMVLMNVLNELDRARDWMVILSSQKVAHRLAGFFLVLCTRYAGLDHLLRTDKGTIDLRIPISRADLAHLLGTRPESISRAFHALADDGLITILRPDLVRIDDLEALVAEAGDEDLGGRVNVERLSSLSHKRT